MLCLGTTLKTLNTHNSNRARVLFPVTQVYLVLGDLCLSAAVSVVVLLLVEAPAARLLALVTSGLYLCYTNVPITDTQEHARVCLQRRQNLGEYFIFQAYKLAGPNTHEQLGDE